MKSPWLTAAIPMEKPYCSCKPTRAAAAGPVQAGAEHEADPQLHGRCVASPSARVLSFYRTPTLYLEQVFQLSLHIPSYPFLSKGWGGERVSPNDRALAAADNGAIRCRPGRCFNRDREERGSANMTELSPITTAIRCRPRNEVRAGGAHDGVRREVRCLRSRGGAFAYSCSRRDCHSPRRCAKTKEKGGPLMNCGGRTRGWGGEGGAGGGSGQQVAAGGLWPPSLWVFTREALPLALPPAQVRTMEDWVFKSCTGDANKVTPWPYSCNPYGESLL